MLLPRKTEGKEAIYWQTLTIPTPLPHSQAAARN